MHSEKMEGIYFFCFIFRIYIFRSFQEIVDGNIEILESIPVDLQQSSFYSRIASVNVDNYQFLCTSTSNSNSLLLWDLSSYEDHGGVYQIKPKFNIDKSFTCLDFCYESSEIIACSDDKLAISFKLSPYMPAIVDPSDSLFIEKYKFRRNFFIQDIQ